MFDRFTEQARQAVVLSHQAAHEHGHETIDTGDFLLGLAGSEGGIARHALAKHGVTVEALRAQLVVVAPAAAAVKATKFAPDARRVLEQSVKEAVHIGHLNFTTGHVLLAMLVVPETVAVQALEALGVELDRLRETVESGHTRADVPEAARPLHRAVADIRLNPTPRLPGRGAVGRHIAFSLIWYLATLAMLVTVTDAPYAALAALPLTLVYLLIGLFSNASTERFLIRLAMTAPKQVELPDWMVEVLVDHGVTDCRVHVQANGQIRDRCFRRGRRAWIVLSQDTLGQPDNLRFVLTHEIGHVVRRDTLRRQLDMGLYLGAFFAAVFTFDLSAAALVLGANLLHWTIARWLEESACDKLGVQWAGHQAMRSWADRHKALLRLPGNRKLRRRLLRLRRFLTHPPLAWRVAWQARGR